jgi:vacuolar protein sorting-associated protein 13D
MVTIGSSGLGRKLSLNIETSDIVNFNVTSTLLELYHVVKDNWTQNYYSGLDQQSHDVYHPKRKNSNNMILDNDTSPSLRRRTLYVPFALRNDTG